MLDLVGAGQHRLKIAVLVDQLSRRLHPDAGDAGHVVRRIAGQGLHVDHLVGADAEAFHHLGGSDIPVLHGVHHAHAIADQLHQVLVRRHDGHLGAGLDGQAGVSGNQVVGLESGHLDAGDVEGAGRFAHQVELRNQFVRRRRPVGLVVGIDVVAEGAPPGVEDDGDVVGVGLLDQLYEHCGEAVDGVDGRAVGARHRRQGVEGAKQEPRAVDEEDVAGLIGARAQWSAASSAPSARTKVRLQYGQTISGWSPKFR